MDTKDFAIWKSIIGRRTRKPANNPSFVLDFDGFQAQEFNYYLVTFTLLIFI